MTAATPALRIEPLSGRHDRKRFASGVEPLDRYLQQHAGQDAKRRIASCFVLLGDDDPAPVGPLVEGGRKLFVPMAEIARLFT